MSEKILFTDLDGTLLNSAKKVSPGMQLLLSKISNPFTSTARTTVVFSPAVETNTSSMKSSTICALIEGASVFRFLFSSKGRYAFSKTPFGLKLSYPSA